MNLIENFKAARRVGTPLIAISCFDPEATMQSIQASIEDKKTKTSIIQWDVIRGWIARNEHSKEAIGEALRGGEDGVPIEATQDPVEHLVFAVKFPDRTILFVIGGHNYFDKPPYVQALWNLRDQYKATRRTVVLLVPA